MPIYHLPQNNYITVRAGKKERSDFPARDGSQESALSHVLRGKKNTQINIAHAPEVSHNVSTRPECEPAESLNLAFDLTPIHKPSNETF